MNRIWRLWRKTGLVVVIFAVSVLFWYLIQNYSSELGANSLFKRIVYFSIVWVLTLTILNFKIGHRAMKVLWHRYVASDKKETPAEESRVAQTPPHNITVNEIRTAMRHIYGRRWSKKVRILLVTGKVSDVEQLTPHLTSQYWQEDQGTLLLWGGDPASTPDIPWFIALRKLRRCPADGQVWVTTTFDQLSYPGLAPSGATPSGDALDTLVHGLNTHTSSLGWTLPLYVWSLHPRAGKQEGRITQAVGCLLPSGCKSEILGEQLAALTPSLIAQGIQQVSGSPKHDFLLSLAEQFVSALQSVTEPLSVMLNPYRPLPLAGVVFSPVVPGMARSMTHRWALDNRWDVLPESVRALPTTLRPHKPGVNWRRIVASVTALLMVLWGGWMLISYASNRSLIAGAQSQAAQAAAPKQHLADRLLALSGLQKTISRLQYRAEHQVPWYARAGLSHNDELLMSLLPRYRDSAQPLLRDAAATHLEEQLAAFVSLPPDSPQRERMAKMAYDQLKLYLMMSQPQHMDAAWFSNTFMHEWPQRAGVADGVWKGIAPSLLAFWGAQLATHPEWRLPADENLVGQARTLLIRQMGMRNNESTLYQKMLAQVSHLYADMRLEDMTGDTEASRLFTTDSVVPGMFTRAAWEQAVQPAIEKVVKERREELDWVLTDNTLSPRQKSEPEALKNRLTERYFADFGGAWLEFLNSLRWKHTATLSDAIDQLTLMADVRQSPLVALMNTLSLQGRTGQTGEALTDSLVKSAKNLLGGDKQQAIDQSVDAQGPLDATFGPVLTLMEKSQNGNSALSLQTFLTRVTQVRLRLQQVTNATDPQAMTQTLAQTVFQGKAVDLTETRDYGSLMAAGLGQEWSGFGQTVFVRPMEQAWQQVLNPAAESLNARWRAAMVDDWNSAFAGRYPFKNVSSDASLPLLAKYLNADTGRIVRFLQTNLNGVLRREGNRWVPDTVNAQGLTFNPVFLNAINTLSEIADVVFTNGEAGMHFDLRPGTAAGVMQTDLIIDSQKLVYVNQMPAWKRFAWPADTEAPGASLSWISTQTGTRQYADLPGSWGFIRLLDMARREAYPGTASSWSLSWKAQDGRMLNYTLRTEAGEGPLALLKLRDFTLPDTIFNVSDAPQSSVDDAALKDTDNTTEGTD